MRFLYHCSADDRSVLEHIFQIDKITVMHMLRIIIRIMKMDDTLFIRFDNIFRQKHSLRQVTADLSCHIISLHAVDRRIFIGIFLFDIFVIALNK